VRGRLEPSGRDGGLVVVLAAGTSDLARAKEAQLTARYLGRPPSWLSMSASRPPPVLGRLDLLRPARVVVVAAGMDGALPSVVAGLIEAPVVALPTSVGYGAAFEGLAALLAMLNAVRNRRGGGEHRQRLWRRSPGGTDRGAMSQIAPRWIDASAGVAGDMFAGCA
jgi:NCAIR mutase (PurE)-related protein